MIKLPMFEGLSRKTAMGDVVAGITLASMNIPQVLGYTRISRTPVVTGLYTALLPLLAFTIFASSRHLVVAADSATAAIFASSLSPMATPPSAKYLALVGMVALLTAALLLLARIFKLGFLADFMSRTVLVGFLAGVGVQVAIAMLADMSGIAVTSRRSLMQLWQVAAGAPGAHLPTLGLSILAAAVILIGRRLAPHLPVALAVVVASIAASELFDFTGRGVAIVGPVPAGLPSFTVPLLPWSDVLALLPVAASCVIMIIAQSAATARAFGIKYRERVDGDADILGLAAANLAAGFSGTFVVNGSPTQTAMAERAGARSQVAQQTFAAIVLIVLLVLTGPLQYLPRGVLAGIVFTIAVGMIDVPGLAAIRRESPGEFSLAGVTALAVVGVGVEQGILLAIALSLFRHVRHSYRPHTQMLVPGPDGRWQPVPTQPGRETEPGLIVYRFGADLFYANDDRFDDEVRKLIKQAPSPVRWFIVEAGAITDLDYSAARSLRDLIEDLKVAGVTLVFARVSLYLRADMERHRLTEIVGADHIFSSLHEAVDVVRREQAGAGS
jgi:high affinity sulfate transporter 1